MNEIKISIIVPVYQAEQFLSECLLSLLKQNITDYEIICIDDGSTDNSAKIIGEFQQNHTNLRYFYQENQGVSSARNKGIELAKGKYIMFVDADDTIKINCLKYLYHTAEKKNCDLLVFGGKTDLPLQAPEWMRMALYTATADYETFSPDILYSERGAQPCVWNKLYKKSCIGNIRFQENISIAEDMTFLFLLFPTVHKISFVRKKIYFYRISNIDSAMHQTSQKRLKYMECHIKAAETIIDTWKSYGLLQNNQNRFATWLTAFLRGPYKTLEEKERLEFEKQTEKLYENIGFPNLLLTPESQGDSHFTPKRIFRILFRDIRQFGLRGGIENMIYKILYR